MQTDFIHNNNGLCTQDVFSSLYSNSDISKAILDSLPCGVLVLDSFGYIRQCNPIAITLLQLPLIGEKWLDIVKREINTKNSNPHELKLGSGRIINLATQSLGAMPGQLIMLTDITEMHLLREENNRSQRLSCLGKMAACLAHQVRNPLTTALLHANQFLDEKIYNSSKKEMYIGFGHKLVENLLQIEQQLKNTLSYAGEKIKDLNLISIDLLIEKIKKLTESQFYNSANQIIFPSINSNLYLRCNLHLLLGSIQNCINNSIEAATHQVIIKIVIEKNDVDNTIDLMIVDNGPGMSIEIQKKIFAPFFTTKADGIGLGLVVAKTIAELHDGKIWVKSEPEKGTTIGFRLPLTSGEER